MTSKIYLGEEEIKFSKKKHISLIIYIKTRSMTAQVIYKYNTIVATFLNHLDFTYA